MHFLELLIDPQVYIGLLLQVLQQVRYSSTPVNCSFKEAYMGHLSVVVVVAWLKRRRVFHG